MSSCQNNIYKKPPRSLVVGLTGGWTSPVALRKQTRGATPSSPAICHFRWGHPRRGGGAGNKGKVQEVFFFLLLLPFSLGGVFCLDLLRPRFARTPFFPPRALLRTATQGWLSGEIPKRTKEEAESVEGPRSGWGSSLCCWSGCHITPCGDDCAIYCLAGAGDLRQRRRTGSTRTTELTVFANRINWTEAECASTITVSPVRRLEGVNMFKMKHAQSFNIYINKVVLMLNVVWVCVSLLSNSFEFHFLSGAWRITWLPKRVRICI